MTDDLVPMDELHDDELGQALRSLAGGPVGPADGDAYAHALPRFVRARRRRRATIAAGALAACLLVGAGIGLTRTTSLFSSVRTTDPAGPGPGTSQDTPGPSGDGQKDPGGSDGATGPDSTTSTTSRTGSDPASPTSSTTTRPNETPVSTVPTTPTGPKQYSSAGGSIQVQLGARSVNLLSNSPVAGYAADIRSSGPAEVEVRFRQGTSGKTEHAIRIRFDSNGQLLVEIT